VTVISIASSCLETRHRLVASAAFQGTGIVGAEQALLQRGGAGGARIIDTMPGASRRGPESLGGPELGSGGTG
jgi:hypothetical protein